MTIIRLSLISICFSICNMVWSQTTIDHSIWNELLQKYVDESGMVNYTDLQKEKDQLGEYNNVLKRIQPATNWSDAQKLSYWLNAYNFYTVKIILDHYPLTSIKEIKDGNVWDVKFIILGQDQYSLNDIEHHIIREMFHEPRIHFALNCAALSCPKLNNVAFTPDNLEQELEQLTKEFVNNTDKNTITSNELILSKIFDWYKEDFTSDGSLIGFLNQYSQTKINKNATISFQDYNWKINGH